MKKAFITAGLIVSTLLSFSIIIISITSLQNSRDEAIFFKHGETILISDYPEVAMKYEKQKLEKLGFEDIEIQIVLEKDGSASVVTMFAKKDSNIPRIFGPVTTDHSYVGKKIK